MPADGQDQRADPVGWSVTGSVTGSRIPAVLARLTHTRRSRLPAARRRAARADRHRRRQLRNAASGGRDRLTGFATGDAALLKLMSVVKGRPALRGAGRRVRPPAQHIRRPDPPGAAGRRATTTTASPSLRRSGALLADPAAACEVTRNHAQAVSDIYDGLNASAEDLARLLCMSTGQVRRIIEHHEMAHCSSENQTGRVRMPIPRPTADRTSKGAAQLKAMQVCSRSPMLAAPWLSRASICGIRLELSSQPCRGLVTLGDLLGLSRHLGKASGFPSIGPRNPCRPRHADRAPVTQHHLQIPNPR